MQLILAFLRFDFQVARQYRFRVLTDLVQAAATVYLFYFISKSIGPTQMFQGEYFPFLVCGLAFSRLYRSLGSASVSKLYDLQYLGLLENIFTLPYSRWRLILSFGSSAIIKDLIYFAVFLLIASMVFPDQFQPYTRPVPWLLAIAVVFMLVFSQLLALASTCSILLFKRINVVTTFSGLTMALLTGVYFPIKVLPEWLQIVAQALPFTHLMDLFRQGIGQSVDQLNTTSSLLILSGYLIVLGVGTAAFYRYAHQRLLENGRLAGL